MSDYVLVLNSGSSSLKFSSYIRAAGQRWTIAAHGRIEGIGNAARFVVRDGEGNTVCDARVPAVRDARGALTTVEEWLRTHYSSQATLLGVGHRVVHGGTHYAAPTLVTEQVLADLRALIPLAPLHQPHNLGAIEAIRERAPGVPQVACFDTSFHRGLPAVAQLIALPAEIRSRGVQRYGFHGLSYEYIAEALPQVAPEIAAGRVIVAHLGSGASLCALKERKSLDCTLSFTALDGLCMGTRPGSVDPGVMLHLFQTLKLSADEIETILYTKSGLLGISGTSSDMRDLLASEAPAAKLAVDYFVYSAAKQIGALAAVLGGVDGLVFTAGIGERSAEIRARICASAAWLGLELDPRANEKHGPRISRAASRVSAWVVPTNEELMIARHTERVLGLTAA